MIYRAAIFDMDGTIADTLEDLFDSVNEMLAHYNFPPRTFDEVRQAVGNGARKLIQRVLPADKSSDADFVQTALDYYNDCYFRHMTNKVRPYDGIIELLTTLSDKKIPIGVCTNKQHFAAIEIANKVFAQIKFEAVSGDEEGRPKKPDPTRALEIIKKIGIEPAEVAYFGDSAVDMKTAVNAGFLPVGVTWGFRPETELVESGAKIIIHSPLEIFNLVRFE